MTPAPPIRSDPGDDAVEVVAMCRRLGTMDPPALRSLAVDLQRMSDESSASPALRAVPAIEAKAGRHAQHAAAVRAALASVGSET